ncbi:hypothetical protein [Bifidobacterium favimelis]|uniref:Uncharacterized protein n=1 Tax=Bifidobacterium favimelis TaxID=3122979 RepID=A0ABU8ZM91_9BIFI
MADLPVQVGEVLSLCRCEAWLVLLVDDLVEVLVEECGDLGFEVG